MLVLDLLDGKAIQVTNDNIFDLTALSKELGFSALVSIIETFKASPDHRLHLQQCDIDTLLPMLERVLDDSAKHGDEIKRLREEISELRQTTRDDQTAHWEHLSTTAIELKSALTAVQQRISGLDSRLSDLSKSKANMSEVRTLTDKLSSSFTADLRRMRAEIDAPRLSDGLEQIRRDVARQQSWQPWLDSDILSFFPKIFDEFREKRFSLPWRGGPDGFAAAAFHGRCDGHANTLTVILDTNGNVFGGFTPVARRVEQKA
jgi:predicted  nucleic acid-binding Zn-ribbon protein